MPACTGPSVGILALEAAARAAGRWVTAAYADAADEASVVEAAQHLSAQGVDGVIVLAPHARALTALGAAGLGLPVTALHSTDATLCSGRLLRVAVAHLTELGHRRIAHLAGPDDWLEAVARAEGFDAGARRATAELGRHVARRLECGIRCLRRATTSRAPSAAATARPRCSSRTTRWRSA